MKGNLIIMNVENDLKTVTELVNSCEPLLLYLTAKYRLKDNPEYEDIISDARMVLVKRAQIFDKNVNNNFNNFCYPYVRNQILESVSRCQTVKYGSNVHTMSEQIKYRGVKSNRIHMPFLSYKICLDKEVSNDSNDPDTLHNLLGTVNFDWQGLLDPPDYLAQIFNSLELKLVKMLWMTRKERKQYGTNAWKLDTYELLSEYSGSKNKTMLIGAGSVCYYRYKLALKACRYYRAKGHNVKLPNRTDDWQI
jgi:hypothetical protein